MLNQDRHEWISFIMELLMHDDDDDDDNDADDGNNLICR